MEENIADSLLKTADVLHWLGRYRECNTLILLSRLLRAENVETLDDLEEHVGEAERAKRFLEGAPDPVMTPAKDSEPVDAQTEKGK